MKIKCGESEFELMGSNFKNFRQFAHLLGLVYSSWENGQWIEIFPQRDQDSEKLCSDLK